MNQMISARRSLVVTAADQLDLLRKLPTSGADVCLLELEDGVLPPKREQARKNIELALREFPWQAQERVVRVNRAGTDDFLKDILAIAPLAPDGIMLAKCDNAGDIAAADRILSALELRHDLEPGSIRLWAMIETVQGLGNVEAVCTASPRMTGVIFGAGDLGSEMGLRYSALGAYRRTPMPVHEYLYARGRFVLAARLAGITPMDAACLTYEDADATRLHAEYSAQMGFDGQAATSPRQVPIIHEVFGGNSRDIEWAERVLAEAERAARVDDRAVGVVDGEMIDGPFLKQARLILSRAGKASSFPGQG